MKSQELTSSLGCSDCKSNFNSASSLLQHFAQHVSQDAFKHGSIHPSNGSSIPYLQKKKKKADTILERVLKRNSALRHMIPTSLFEPGPSTRNDTSKTASLSSHLSSFQVTNLEHQNNSEDYITLRQPCELEVTEKNNLPELEFSVDGNSVIEEGNSALNLVSSPYSSPSSSSVSSFSSDITLVKCDFQKRLENCITKLVSKRENGSSDVESDTNETNLKEELFNINTSSKKPKIVSNNEIPVNSDEFADNGEIKEVVPNSDSKEYFVVKESEGRSDLCSVIKPEGATIPEDLQIKAPRKASSRKQKSPKKIHFVQNAKLENVAIETYGAVSDLSQSFTMPKKKYPCHLCTRAFGWSTDLKRHILTHTGERPFRCNACDATFTRNFLLQKHQSKIHSLRFTTLKESTMSNLHSSRKESLLNGVPGEDVEQESIEKRIDIDVVRCSNDKCNQKESGLVTNTLGRAKSNNPQQNKLDKISSLGKGKDLCCNKISYEIFSHEALNIL
ncbi:hypothetical protein C0J52_02555 [Blattella germanica]|nr:hypothetical protein C0J52_02555 [Blattella germanica]